MKLKTGIMLLAGCIFCAGSVFAQENERPKKRPGPGMRGPGQGERGPGFHGPGASGGKSRRPLEHYMSRLKQSDPAAFEELQRLKTEDPEAFKEKLNQRLSQGRFKDRFKDFPEMAALFERMPEERRREMMGRFMMRGPGPDGAHAGDDNRREKYAEMQKQFSSLAAAYNGAADESEREAVRKQVTQQVTSFFESRQEERRKHIERMRAELGKFEQMMSDDESKRSEMIERRVDEVLARFGKKPENK